MPYNALYGNPYVPGLGGVIAEAARETTEFSRTIERRRLSLQARALDIQEAELEMRDHQGKLAEKRAAKQLKLQERQLNQAILDEQARDKLQREINQSQIDVRRELGLAELGQDAAIAADKNLLETEKAQQSAFDTVRKEENDFRSRGGRMLQEGGLYTPQWGESISRDSLGRSWAIKSPSLIELEKEKIRQENTPPGPLKYTDIEVARRQHIDSQIRALDDLNASSMREYYEPVKGYDERMQKLQEEKWEILLSPLPLAQQNTIKMMNELFKNEGGMAFENWTRTIGPSIVIKLGSGDPAKIRDAIGAINTIISRKQARGR